MTQYIDKDALAAEIEKWQDGIKKGIFSIPLTGRDKAFATFEYEVLGKIKDFLDTLGVKEANLEKEMGKYLDVNNIEYGFQVNYPPLKMVGFLGQES